MIPGRNVSTAHPWGDADTPYLALGGADGVRRLVEEFYDAIDTDSPALRAMLPSNLDGTRAKFFEYMSGWLGGPPLYTDKRGHPQLRRRHMPFRIGAAEADEWMRCMAKAIDNADVREPLAQFLIDKLAPLARHMVNTE